MHHEDMWPESVFQAERAVRAKALRQGQAGLIESMQEVRPGVRMLGRTEPLMRPSKRRHEPLACLEPLLCTRPWAPSAW